MSLGGATLAALLPEALPPTLHQWPAWQPRLVQWQVPREPAQQPLSVRPVGGGSAQAAPPEHRLAPVWRQAWQQEVWPPAPDLAQPQRSPLQRDADVVSAFARSRLATSNQWWQARWQAADWTAAHWTAVDWPVVAVPAAAVHMAAVPVTAMLAAGGQHRRAWEQSEQAAGPMPPQLPQAKETLRRAAAEERHGAHAPPRSAARS